MFPGSLILLNIHAHTYTCTHAHTLTCYRHIDLAGSTIGIAFTSTMCSSTSSVGLSQDRGTDGVFSTAAHELGHIMNMDHDDASELLVYVYIWSSV